LTVADEPRGDNLRVFRSISKDARMRRYAGSLDECPMAYKAPEGIISAIGDTVNIEKSYDQSITLKQVAKKDIDHKTIGKSRDPVRNELHLGSQCADKRAIRGFAYRYIYILTWASPRTNISLTRK